MSKDDKHQRELPYGAAQGSYDERRLKVGMTIGAMYDPETAALSKTYTGAPVMELRVLLLLMLDEEARGRLLTPEEMIKPPWGLLCSERTVRRVLKFARDLGILQSVRRLQSTQQKFITAWQIDWAGMTRFIRSKASGHVGKPPGQTDNAAGQFGQTDGRFGNPRTSSSFSSLKELDVDDVVFREDPRTDWPEGQNETTGHGRGPSCDPESVNEASHGGPPTARLVSAAPRRAVNHDIPALVGLVRQCGVIAAPQAVQSAIEHGHDVRAVVAGWKVYCRPGCDADFAAKRLYYRFIDPPMGFEPHQGWVVQHPNRIRSKEEVELEEAKLRAEAEAKAREAQAAVDREALKQWALALPAAERESLLKEFYEAPENKATVDIVRKQPKPLENGFFLMWLSKKHGGMDGSAV